MMTTELEIKNSIINKLKEENKNLKDINKEKQLRLAHYEHLMNNINSRLVNIVTRKSISKKEKETCPLKDIKELAKAEMLENIKRNFDKLVKCEDMIDYIEYTIWIML